MNELFVPYSIAIQLKEIRFDEDCLAYWAYKQLKIWQDGLRPVSNMSFISFNDKYEYYAAPLYDQVISYLWEKHGIEIQYKPSLGKEYLSEEIRKAIRDIQNHQSGK